MKKFLKIGILIFIMTGSFQGFGQPLHYNITKQGKISSLNFITKFNKSSTYDGDFKENTPFIDVNFKVSIAVNENGTGKMYMTLGENAEKIAAVIESAYELKYKNSPDKYWKFQCIVENNYRITYVIDFKNKSISRFWFDADNNTRTYFLIVI